MKKIYAKDECSPDALSAEQWLKEKEKEVVFLKHVEHKFNQESTQYFFSPTSNQFYSIEYSCGVYETLYEISAQYLQTALK